MNQGAPSILDLIGEQRPLLDVRAPGEFARGSLPGAVNLPLLDDDQRAQIGLCYKQQGAEAAVELGHHLISGELKLRRIHHWAHFFRDHPDGVLFCYRGGLRSAITQQWLRELGLDIPRIEGGYKAARQLLISQLELLSQQRLLRIGGRTGTGKTDVLVTLPNALDFEGAANHRGSAFGSQLSPQPSQVDFEHRIVRDWLCMGTPDRVIVEDESRGIGTCYFPTEFHLRLQQMELVMLDAPMDERIARIRRDYVDDRLARLQSKYPDHGFALFSEWLLASLQRIRKRLGGERTRELTALMQRALDAQLQRGDASGHDGWIHRLLHDYYDPMYDYQRSRKAEQIVFSGHAAEVAAFATDWLGPPSPNDND